jgi:hypothetical protein
MGWAAHFVVPLVRDDIAVGGNNIHLYGLLKAAEAVVERHVLTVSHAVLMGELVMIYVILGRIMGIDRGNAIWDSNDGRLWILYYGRVRLRFLYYGRVGIFCHGRFRVRLWDHHHGTRDGDTKG